MNSARVKFAVVDCRALRRCDFCARLLSAPSFWDRAMSGFFLLARKIRKMSLFTEKPYDPFRAWVDLLLEANFAAKPDRFGEVVERGELHTSEHTLALAWGWERSRVRRFLARLEAEQRIEQETNKRRTKIRITNYERYQRLAASSEQPTEQEAEQVSNNEPNTTELSTKQLNKKHTKSARSAAPVDNLVFPPNLDTPTFRSAWAAWVRYREETKQVPYFDLAEQQDVLNAHAGYTAARVMAAMTRAQSPGRTWLKFYAHDEPEPVKVAAPVARPEHKVFKAPALSPTEKRLVAMAQKPKEKKPA